MIPIEDCGLHNAHFPHEHEVYDISTNTFYAAYCEGVE